MLNPSMFMKTPQPNALTNKKIQIDKISGIERTRWDEPIEVPPILYQKFKVPPPQQSSQQATQVNYHIPQSLIEFIRRAYNRCKDAPLKKAMEAELKEIFQANKANLDAVNWDAYQIPNVGMGGDLHEKGASHVQQYHSRHPFLTSPSIAFTSQPIQKSIQKQTLMIPSAIHNQSLIDKIQKQSNQTQSKTKQLVSKKLQMLMQKYQQAEKQDQTQNQSVAQIPQKTFIGFKDEKEVRLEMLRQKYQTMADKTNKIPQQTQPHPPTQKIIPTHTSKPTTVKPLQVVESKMPQKVYQVKPLPQSVKKPTIQKKQPTQQITRQQLAQIVRAGKQQDLRTVAKRFTQFNKVKPIKNIQVEQQVDQQDLDYKIVGKCTKIDKPYLRITHRPDPQTVRPETILRKAFNHYKMEYKKNVPYDQILSQFRSIRQDLTVQNIRNSFTVEVYEQNFKMSLYEDDTIQMKQCQTNLWQLYRQGLYNKRSQRTKFISYHFITMVLQQRFKELQYMLTQIPTEVLEDKQVQESLSLKRFLVIGNYNAFFTFYNSQDETCQKLMNHYIDKVRVKFLVMAAKTFGEKISFRLLGQNCAEDEDVLQALAVQQGATVNEGSLMLKDSYEKLKESEYLKVKKVTSLLD